MYRKRENLHLDISEWGGWEVHARSERRDIFVIILRRKFIPPFLEGYIDLAFVLYGPAEFAK